jgi:hypothetical protein
MFENIMQSKIIIIDTFPRGSNKTNK